MYSLYINTVLWHRRLEQSLIWGTRGGSITNSHGYQGQQCWPKDSPTVLFCLRQGLGRKIRLGIKVMILLPQPSVCWDIGVHLHTQPRGLSYEWWGHMKVTMNMQGNALPLCKQHSLWMHALAALERESIVLHTLSECAHWKTDVQTWASWIPVPKTKQTRTAKKKEIETIYQAGANKNEAGTVILTVEARCKQRNI